MTALAFPLAAFLGATLLFFVEPLVARVLLPWFGGAASVWATSLVFFQTVLVAGYAWAHYVATRVAPRRQWQVHGALLALAVLALGAQAAWWPAPLVPPASLRPLGGAAPAPRLVLLLLASCGLPFFALAATGPLTTAWFSRARPGASPLRLYALSNAGSLLALVAYPLLVEPALPLRRQAALWAVAMASFAVACAACGFLARHGELPPRATASSSPRPRALWLILSGAASLLLVATTNQLCLEIASAPFLWVVPLALYLVTLIVAFERPGWYRRGVVLAALALATPAALTVMYRSAEVPLPLAALALSALLFFGALFCHGELVRLRPADGELTGFYLHVAAGGALGGAFVALVAPAVFRFVVELHLGLVLLWVLALAMMARDPSSALNGSRRRGLRALGGLGVGVLTAACALQPLADPGRVFASRDFYGALAVQRFTDEAGAIFFLRHGGIYHGAERVEAAHRGEVTLYYGPDSGIGRVLGAPAGPRHVGVVGLGVGTLAAYARPGDRFTIYEIDPAVVRLARGEGGYFDYLQRARGAVNVVLGDARLSLESEAPNAFDVLALDAFSSDAVPVHLLTREAFALYARHLAPGGVLAVHVSNRFLDLAPVVTRLADDVGLQCRWVHSGESGLLFTPSEWLLLARDAERLTPARVGETARCDEDGVARLWTDDYSALLAAVRPRGR